MSTHVIARPRDEAPRPSVVNQWDLLTPLDVDGPDPARDPLEMVEDAQATESVDRRLRDARIGSAHPLVIVHVSAGNPFQSLASPSPSRHWSSRWRGAIRHGGSFLTSGPSDAPAAKAVADRARAALGAFGAAVPDVGEFDLVELRALVGRAAVYIGGDSGPLHIAGTTTTPIVALLGPTLAERSMPWRDTRWFASG